MPTRIPTKVPAEKLYVIRDPKNLYSAMRDDVRLLLDHRSYVSLSTLIVCCIDALAAHPGKAKRSNFVKFVQQNFPELEAEMGHLFPGKEGAETFYEIFRNGFVHLRGPECSCAIAEESELPGQWAGSIDVGGNMISAINIDRIAHEFLGLMDRLNPVVAGNPPERS